MEAEGWMVLVHDPIGLDPVRKQRPKVKQRLKLKTDAEAETEGEAETEAEARTESSDFCICSSLQGRSREAKTEDEDRRLMKIGDNNNYSHEWLWPCLLTCGDLIERRKLPLHDNKTYFLAW
uniref:Uncharacterized protein n=1 Tax=Populus alba TaxID=43335 RepID=A0A4U5NRX5_POPAL|nr:hypothetical protein D5086_0000242560 [Populus alba]